MTHISPLLQGRVIKLNLKFLGISLEMTRFKPSIIDTYPRKFKQIAENSLPVKKILLKILVNFPRRT